MTTISVVIPAYNAEATIGETVDSVLHQTFSDIEVIVVIDRSSDSTFEIVSAKPDPRIKVIVCDKGNAAASRNIGFAQASGEWIAFLDSDDLWLPDNLSNQWKALQPPVKAAVAYSWFDRIDESGKLIGIGGRCNYSGNVHAELLLSNIVGNGSNSLIARAALEAVGGFDESLSHSEDRDLYVKLAEKYEFVSVPKVNLLYRVSMRSKSFRDIFRSEASYLQLIEGAYNRAPESLRHLKSQSFSNHYQYLISKALSSSSGWKKYWIALQLWTHYCVKRPGCLSFLLLKRDLLLKILNGAFSASGFHIKAHLNLYFFRLFNTAKSTE
ncbi:glycosyltransferase family 2 protein [Phormidesmis sp. 146-35]